MTALFSTLFLERKKALTMHSLLFEISEINPIQKGFQNVSLPVLEEEFDFADYIDIIPDIKEDLHNFLRKEQYYEVTYFTVGRATGFD